MTSQNTTHKKHRHYFSNFIKWRQLHVTDSGFTLLLALIAGTLAGTGAWLLKLLINLITTTVSTNINTIGYNWLIIIIPAAGIIAAALFSRCILKCNVDNGVARIMQDIKDKSYRLSSKTITGSMIASALTLGFGGTAGSEGPIAYAGAGIGSKLGQLFKVKQQTLITLIGCGAAAGIAGIFKAPIGGALFAIEVLRIELSTLAIMGVFLATLSASLVAYVLSGCTLDIEVISPGAFDNSTILWSVLLGLTCGAYSLYYTWTGSVTKHALLKTTDPWLRWISSGIAIGLMIYMFPALYGEGYGIITKIINGNYDIVTHDSAWSYASDRSTWIIVACSGILLLKGIGSSATNNGGGVAGDFAPTLFAGCILGLLFSSILDITGITHLNQAHYALIAMAGAMAGIIRAPLMSIFLTTEMVGGVEFLLPATIVAFISYWMVMIFKRDTFYHSHPFIS